MTAETPDTTASDSRLDAIRDALRQVRDPEIPVNIVELGLIYEIAVNDDDHATIRMTLTTPNCPMAEVILQDVRRQALTVDGIAGADVDLVWEPVWTADRMSEAARLELEFTGHVPGPGGGKPSGMTSLTVGKTRRPHDRRR